MRDLQAPAGERVTQSGDGGRRAARAPVCRTLVHVLRLLHEAARGPQQQTAVRGVRLQQVRAAVLRQACVGQGSGGEEGGEWAQWGGEEQRMGFVGVVSGLHLVIERVVVTC